MTCIRTQTAKTSTLLLITACFLFLSACGTAERTTTSNGTTKKEGTSRPPVQSPDSTFYDGSGSPPAKVLVTPSESNARAVQLVEQGRASWYGSKFHGRLTANGEQFNMNRLTAAHRTLPFNTLVWVWNKDNGKSVQVRINDRGPFAKDRIIDLSKKAADKIGMIGPGTANVELYVAKRSLDQSQSTNLAVPTYTIQLGSFDTEARAFNHSSKIKGSRVEIIRKKNRTVYRVYYGLYIDKDDAYQKQKELERKNYSGFVKQIEN